jgi:DNA (cytosine-5)-methyltransferase 1
VTSAFVGQRTRPRTGGLRVASVCSSVGGLDLGLHRAGHRTVSFCEADPWRRQVLNRHWPDVPVHPDLKELAASDLPPCDLFVGGTPCQDLSHAGRRAGLDGERSGLFHAFAQLRIDLYDLHGCAWSLWENVAGALSSNAGRDFATVLASHVGADVAVPAGGWAGSGVVIGPWGAAEWRLLDAQFFGVPQRRRRVFVVGYLGADRAPSVLADPARRFGNPAQGEDARPHPAAGPHDRADRARISGALTARDRKDVDSDGSPDRLVVAATLTGGEHQPGTRPPGRRQEDDVNIIASALDTARGGVDDNDAQARHIVVSSTLRSHSLPSSTGPGAVAFHATQTPIGGAISPALGTNMQIGAHVGASVRRLTPTERERLMGWPDGWTYADGASLLDGGADGRGDIPPDGRREAATGDGVVAHVAEWIGLKLNIETEGLAHAA